MKQAQFGLLAVVLSFTLSAQAKFESHPEMPQILKFQGKQMDSRYFQIGSVEVTELQTEELRPQDVNIMRFDAGVTDSSGDWIGNLGTTLDQVDLVVDKVINIGKKVWAVVEKGRPVVDIKADVATALPSGARSWLDLENWRAPVSRTWGISFKNLYGVEVVKYVYRVIYVAGGSANGVGQYIGYATVQPVELNVAWGYTFNSEATVPTVYNLGSRSNPIGGLTLQVKWSIETVLKKTIQSQSFSIDGRGTLTQLQ